MAGSDARTFWKLSRAALSRPGAFNTQSVESLAASEVRAGAEIFQSQHRLCCTPEVVVAGHLHEDHGCTTDEVTLFVNASTCTSEYNPTHRPIVFDLPRREQLRPVTEAAALHREAQAPRKGKSP